MLPAKRKLPNLFKKKTTKLPPIQKPTLLTPSSLRTTNPKTYPAISCRTTRELIRESMKRIDWKADYGVAVHVGIEDSIPVINEIAGWLNERFRQPLIIIDDGIKPDSLLKSVSGSGYRTPPSVQGDTRLYNDAQELLDEKGKLPFPIHFLSVPTKARGGLTALSTGVKPGTVIFGSPDACADVLEAAELAAQPFFYCGGMLAVRAA